MSRCPHPPQAWPQRAQGRWGYACPVCLSHSLALLPTSQLPEAGIHATHSQGKPLCSNEPGLQVLLSAWSPDSSFFPGLMGASLLQFRDMPRPPLPFPRHCLLSGELPHPFLRPLRASRAIHSKTDTPGPDALVTVCPGPRIQLYGLPLPFQQLDVTSGHHIAARSSPNVTSPCLQVSVPASRMSVERGTQAT